MTTSSQELTAEGASSWDDLLANQNVDGESSPDVILIDTDQDQEPEAALVDVNADSTPDVLLIDTDESGTPDVAVVDLESAGLVTDSGDVDTDLETADEVDSSPATD